MDTRKIKVGDRIKFKAATRSHFRVAVRVVTEINSYGVCVSYHGWRGFVVRPSEILEIIPQGDFV